MKPPAFDYVRPNDVEEVVGILSQAGEDARVLSGGQSLIALLNMRLLHPSIIIDISTLPDHGFIRHSDNIVEVGCTTTQSELQSWSNLSTQLPLLAQALPWVGHRQTRNKGTVCGSIAHADPSAELPLCLAALKGEALLYSSRGERVLGAEELQTGMLETACAPDEIIRALRFPVAETGTGYAFGEVAYRHGDFAIISIAVVASSKSVRMAVGGINDRPQILECPSTQSNIFLNDTLSDFSRTTEVRGDHHASADYRRRVLHSLGLRLVQEAFAWIE